jgi:CheY-like chemotaxis protein
MENAHDLVLVVDDSTDLLEAYQDLLTLTGYEVVVASSGKEALAILDRLRPALLLTDVSMPEMDGFELIQQMQSQLKEQAPPAIVCSGFKITENEAVRRGARLFLSKPVEARTLLASIEALLQGEGPDAGRLEAERRHMAGARHGARLAARQRLTEVPLAREANLILPWLEWLRTYFDCSWSGAFVLTAENLDLLAAVGHPPTDVLRDQPLRSDLHDVIETGSSLVISNAEANPAFHFHSDEAQVRYFVAVPLLSPDDVALGALCLAAPDVRRGDAESLLILEQLGRRGALLLSDDPSIMTEIERRKAPLLAQRVWETIVAMELRLAHRKGASLQLAVIELATDRSARDLAAALWQVSAHSRLAIGSLGPGRIGVCLRGEPDEIAGHLESGLDVMHRRGLTRAAGLVSATRDAALSARELIRIAEGALLAADDARSPSHFEQIEIGSRTS